MTTVRQYLRAWVNEGPARASRYLVADQRTTSDQGSPRLVAGKVLSYRLYRWEGPREFTLVVSMNLTFDGSRMAWNRGVNDRFVTARWDNHQHVHLLEFATGP